MRSPGPRLGAMTRRPGTRPITSPSLPPGPCPPADPAMHPDPGRAWPGLQPTRPARTRRSSATRHPASHACSGLTSRPPPQPRLACCTRTSCTAPSGARSAATAAAWGPAARALAPRCAAARTHRPVRCRPRLPAGASTSCTWHRPKAGRGADKRRGRVEEEVHGRARRKKGGPGRGTPPRAVPHAGGCV